MSRADQISGPDVEKHGPTANLFRHKRTPDLVWAVPEDEPVPTFIGADAWAFVGRIGTALIRANLHQPTTCDGAQLGECPTLDRAAVLAAAAGLGRVMLFGLAPFSYLPAHAREENSPEILPYPSYRLSQTQSTLAALADKAIRDEIERHERTGATTVLASEVA